MCTNTLTPLFLWDRYDRTAGKQWDLFYKRNKDRFFKDRHYLLRDFPDLASPPPLPPPAPSSLTTGEYSCGGGGGNMAAGTSDTARPEPHHTVLVEAGCGVGNAVFPLLESHPDMFVVRSRTLGLRMDEWTTAQVLNLSLF